MYQNAGPEDVKRMALIFASLLGIALTGWGVELLKRSGGVLGAVPAIAGSCLLLWVLLRVIRSLKEWWKGQI